MKTSQHCAACFFRQIEKTIEHAKLAPSLKEKALKYFTRQVLNHDYDLPPVVFGRKIYKVISRMAQVHDIFAKQKCAIEKYLLQHANYVEKVLAKSPDSLYLAAKMACAANSIDFGAGRHKPDLEGLIKKLTTIKLRIDDYARLEKDLAMAHNVLIVADNCGESFFDKFFIEQIKIFNPQVKVFYAVRSAPMINDVTLLDARRLGIDKIAEVFSSGCDYPGLILSKTSKKFKSVYRNADVVISKGQGNFEAFNPPRKNIYYFFQLKCSAVTDFTRLPLNSILLSYRSSVGV
jgi:uncharacterized protein with ATP-grasp and redox domains